MNTSNNSNTNNHKYSSPTAFYISPRLFCNKRLKQKRCKWTMRLKKNLSAQVPATNDALTKNESPMLNIATDSNNSLKCQQIQFKEQSQQNRHQINRKRWSRLHADVTIDLLSDDDEFVDGTNSRSECNNLLLHLPVSKNVMSYMAQPNTDEQSKPTITSLPDNLYVHSAGSLQLSMVPNITLIPVQLQTDSKKVPRILSQPQKQPEQIPFQSEKCFSKSTRHNLIVDDINRALKTNQYRNHPPKILNEMSIVLSDDEGNQDECNNNYNIESQWKPHEVHNTLNIHQPPPLYQPRIKNSPSRSPTSMKRKLRTATSIIQSSPPPLAPLSSIQQNNNVISETVEEVTVSLVPRTSSIGNCNSLHQQERISHNINCTNTVSSSYTSPSCKDTNTLLKLPDETTVHTVIANRIYELSLSKLREGLASSGIPEFTYDQIATQINSSDNVFTEGNDNDTGGSTIGSRNKSHKQICSKLKGTIPPAPISLKLSSDLSISLISDEDDVHSPRKESFPSVEAHAAVKLLQQQHPQLSVVQHLHYPVTTLPKSSNFSTKSFKESPSIQKTIGRNTTLASIPLTIPLAMPVLQPMPSKKGHQFALSNTPTRLTSSATKNSDAMTITTPTPRR